MKDRIRANASTAFFKILVAVTVLLGAASAIFGNMSSKPVGTYLIPSYLETMRSYYLCNTISQCLSVLAVLMVITCILTLIIGNKIISLVIVAGDLLMFGFFFFTSAVPYFQKPHVEKTKLVNADYQYGQYGTDKYRLYFDNGMTAKIPADDYEYGSKGKSYYVVMCGDKSIGVFDAEKYQYSPES